MMRTLLLGLALCLFTSPGRCQDADLPRALRDAAGTRVFLPDSVEQKAHQNELKRLRDQVHRADREAWTKVTTKAQWEAFRDPRIAALRKLLGPSHTGPSKNPKALVTKKIAGDGFVVENVVYAGHHGYFVTANLYSPAKPGDAMPGFVIVHSHHNAKTQSELQDMGINWARRGCLVLVPDLLGHGERRQHPFVDAKNYPEPFKVGRQDYYFRYNLALQLGMVGETLVGWMAADLMNGVSLLLNKPGVDANKIILLGSVAGGGDPAAVTAALDSRIAAVAPFNFGGPQPETKYPLPEDAETSFNYFGSGYWESTRNLVDSGPGGYLPWVIVGSVAPRGLIYGHEFAWDRERDPVWKRLEKIYGLYGAADKLNFATGRGGLSGRPPEATHCNNIGPEHRKPMYPTLQQWFGIAPPEKENTTRIPSSDLQCLTDDARKQFDVKPLHELLHHRSKSARPAAGTGSKIDLSKEMVEAKLVHSEEKQGVLWQSLRVASVHEPTAPIPLLWLKPVRTKQPMQVVVAFALEGKAGFLKQRAETIAALLENGVAVCLPDLRGTGELRIAGEGRSRTSGATSVSVTLGMHGRSIFGDQQRDLQRVLAAVDKQGYRAVAVWGESFAAPNDPKTRFAVPYDAGKAPALGEPGAALLALMAASGPRPPRVVCARGAIADGWSLLDNSFVYLPHDAVVAVHEAGRLTTLLRESSVLLEGSIDGLNRRLDEKSLANQFTSMRKQVARLRIQSEPSAPAALAAWLTGELRRMVNDKEDDKQ